MGDTARRMQIEDVLSQIDGHERNDDRYHELAILAWGKERADRAMYNRLLYRGYDKAGV